MILRRVRVVPRQQPRAGDVGMNSEVSGRQGFHCGEVVPGEGLGWASGGGPARPADHLDFQSTPPPQYVDGIPHRFRRGGELKP